MANIAPPIIEIDPPRLMMAQPGILKKTWAKRANFGFLDEPQVMTCGLGVAAEVASGCGATQQILVGPHQQILDDQPNKS